MINLGIFGDKSVSNDLLMQIKSIPNTTLAGVYISEIKDIHGEIKIVNSPENLINISDALLVLIDKSISRDLLKMFLRKSKHIFLKTLPDINFKEIKELIELEKEAGMVTYIYNPFIYIPWLNQNLSKYENPFMINLNSSFSNLMVRQSHELLLLVTALNRLTGSNYKRLDFFGFSHLNNENTLNIRIEYENGCLINITLSEHKKNTLIDIFTRHEYTSHTLNSPLFGHYHLDNQLFTSINNFCDKINSRVKQVETLNNLLNGLHLVHELREYLRFNGIRF